MQEGNERTNERTGGGGDSTSKLWILILAGRVLCSVLSLLAAAAVCLNVSPPERIFPPDLIA